MVKRKENSQKEKNEMKSKLFIMCIVATLSLFLFACSSAQKEVSVDALYAGKEIEVAVGGSLIVTLESNPTTGFKWELTRSTDDAVLELVDHKFEAPESTLVGAGGKEVWAFKALKKGNSIISMKYSRPWEKGIKAAKTFVLAVIVK